MKKKLLGTAVLLMLFMLPFATQAAIVISETHTNVNCNGASTATIDITPSGGTAPYTYNWSDGPTSQNRTGLVAGNYWVTVTDNLGASNSILVFVSEPAAMTTLISVTSVYCGGGNTGAIDLTVLGGSPGYTYMWSDFVSTEDRTNLTAAVYYVTITDSKGCIKVDSANVTQPPGMVLTKAVTNVTCGSGANGAIDLTVQYGIPGYLYLWNDGAITEDRTAIAAGTYTVTVTDMSGCSASMSAIVGQTGGGMAVNTISSNPGCFGGNNGTITVTSVIGSISPYTFHWSDGPTIQNRTGMSAGSYTVTATSITGCTAAATVNLTQPSQINVTLNPIQLTCFGSNNGAINTIVTGGTSPYTYNWGGGIFTQNRTGLNSGTYTVTVTDFKGCAATQTTFVPEPLQLSVTSVPSPQACIGGPTGSVMTTVTGGTGTYSYWWGAGVTSSNQVNVNSGNYSVTVTDANGCTASATSTVVAYTPMVLSSTQTNDLCYGASTGSANLSVANGWSPFTYAWSNSASTQNVASLAAGSYTVTVSDNHSCTATKTVTITQPSFPININSTITDVTCNGGNNGAISTAVSNGISPYTYNWGGVFTQNRTALTAGNYTLTVTDNNSCSISTSIIVNQPTPISITPTVTNAACFGTNTGSINLSATGSFAPYTYFWSGGAITQNRTGLAQGSYPVTVTDNHSCTASANVVVDQPASIAITPTVVNLICNNISTGSINISVAGGTSPYTYNWGDVTTQNRTSLAAGNYTVTVTDNSGCSSSNTSTVTQPTAITVSSVNTNVSCNAGNNGAINLTVSGGTSPYNYNWGGVTTQNRSSLTAGTYVVTITDNASCTASYSTTITQPATLSASAAVTNITCNGGNNGIINIVVTGGTSPYTFNWGGGITSQNRTGLSQGTYNVTVTDNAGCSAINSSTVNQPAAISVTSTITNASCFGGSNGAINIGVSGGTSPYAYNWGGGAITQNRTGLTAGTYIVTVTDNAGCTVTKSSTISQGTAISITPTVTNASCYGGNNGAINIAVSAGVSPYTFNWGGGVVTQNRTALVAGSYTVTATDNSGCSAANTSTVNQATAIAVSSTTTNVACNGGNTGTINLTVAGGTAPYTFDWGGVTTQNRTGLTAGNYTVTVTDNSACTVTYTATVSQTTSLAVSSTQTNVVCNGGNTGAINTTTTGGTLPYTYNWGGGIVTPNRTGLSAGSYTITVSDNAGCSASNTATITQPAAISVVPVVTNVSCAGGNTGAINITVTGGNSPYTFNWGGVFTQNRTNIAAGTYTVTVTDNTACTSSNTSSVIQNASLSISSTVSNVLCFGGNNGSINITSNGGTVPYTYNWGGGITSQNRTGLAQGSYTVTVTDNTGCSGSLVSNVTQPLVLTTSAVVTNISCNGGSNGAINVSTNGGTSPYTFNWGGGITTQNRTGLALGNYAVTVTDNNSCTASSSAAITQPSTISLSVTPANVVCYGASTGSLALTVTGGTSGYTFNWSNGQITQNNNNIPAGNYVVTVTDANSCNATISATLTEAPQITTSTSIVNATCFGSANGSIDLTVNGGTGAYTYIWSNGATTQDISNITANTYNVTVKDASNCSVVASSSISQPAQVVLTNAHVNVLCNGANNGSIDLTVNGGTGAYTYIWSNGAITQDISVLTAQNYSVTVNDNNSCSATATIAITQPAPLTVAETHTNVSCNGGNNGTINTTPSGGVSPYAFNWGGVTTQNRTGLTVGSYSVTVTDANTCSASVTAAISQPTPLALTTTKTDVTCSGAATGAIDLSVSGGTTNYLYHWDNNVVTQDLAGVIAGTYAVTVTDANSCTAITSATITQPTPITVSFSLANVNCFGGNNGSITANASGGNGGYQFVWSNGGSTSTITNLTAGNYSLSLNDSTGCATTLSFTIAQPSQIVVSETHNNISCNGANNGAIDLSASGGSFPYSYVWSNSATTQDLSSLAPNTYSVTVTDNAACTTVFGPVNITQPVALSLSTVATNVVCKGAGTGAVDLTVTGGGTPYSYHWNNNASSQDLANIIAGNYLVTVTDANSCTAVTSAVVNQSSAIQVTLTKTDATCFGSASGSISTTVTGGNSGYTYNWNNSSTSSSLSSITAGTYTLTIHDAQNCSAVSSATVAQPSQIVIAETHVNVSCNGNTNGTINTAVTGGAGGYIYLWSNSASSANLSALAANSYSLTVTDANACSASGTVSITQPALLTLSETHKPYACSNNAGAIDLTVNGGTAPYSYSWTGGVTTQDRTNLTAGNYSVVVTDAHSCTSTASVAIAQLPPLAANLNKTDVTCHGGNNGVIAVSVQGGTAPYAYSWNQGGNTSNLSNLPAAGYRVLIVDSNSCKTADSTNINEPAAIQIAKAVTNVTCFGLTDGAIDVNVTGGTPGYTYTWNTSATTQSLANLSRGNYTLTVMDANSCTASSGNILVSEPQQLSLASTVVPIGCADHNDGEVQLQVTGGVPPFTYNWSNSATTPNLTNLTTGSYDVTVTDSKGCVINGGYVVGAVPPMVITPVVHNTSCAEVQNGAIDLTVTGGTAAYSFVWNTGDNTEDLSNISQSVYAVTVTDSRNCSAQGNYSIAFDYVLTVDATPSTTINLGESIQLSAVTNVDHSNVYAWSPANAVVCSTCANTEAVPTFNTFYTVNVVDANGCKAMDTLSVIVNSITDIFIPNAFSPNGDGNNDVFQLFGDVSTISFLELAIYDRWGEKVFETNNHNFTWDGTCRGEPAPQGVYIYTAKIVFINGYSRNDMKGSLTIIR